jgi:2-keto-3-deoxy-L-rhamnonate aldolase RhmA
VRAGALVLFAALTMAGQVPAQLAAQSRLNPMIDLLEQKKPIFGVYAPSNRQEALAYKAADFIFDGSMEGNFERGYPGYAAFVKGMADAGALQKAFTPRLQKPLAVKTPEIAPDPAKAIENISRQLNLGTSAIVLVDVKSADEVKKGLAAMRFKANGGTRPDDVGNAPAFWGVTEQEYKQRADLWPLNPKGELVNWTIVESKEGLANIREIAAVKGIGVLFPGAGTLRRVFSTQDASGQRVFDEKGWEAAIQQVLAACKEFNVACGYPATADDIELRMKQGFSVFIMAWGEQGFKGVEIGRKASGREAKELQ